MILISKVYLEKLDMEKIKRDVLKLFDVYDYMVVLSKQYEASKSMNIKEECFVQKKKDPVFEQTARLIRASEYVEKFDKKIEALKETLTEEELIIFQMRILKRKTIADTCNVLGKSYKGMLNIKKSCYVKVALAFGLLDMDENELYGIN